MFTALQVGVEDVLLASRGAVIASGGFRIVSARNAEQAALCMKARPIDLVILCHTLTVEERSRIAHLARRHRRGIPVLLVAGGRDIAQAEGIDAILDPHPRRLLAFLRHLLHQPATGAIATFPDGKAVCSGLNNPL